MAKEKKDKNVNDSELENENENIEETTEVNEEELIEPESFETTEDAADTVEVNDIPLEEFLKNPEELSKYTDEVDVEETTYWCPQCSDYTLFMDRVCTVCGFSKTIKKTSKDEELEEAQNTNFELMPDEDLENLGLQEYDEDKEYE